MKGVGGMFALALGLVAVMAVVAYMQKGSLLGLMPNQPTPTVVKDFDFVQTGNLRAEKTFWLLVYEEPGKPALQAKLFFTPDSRCNTQVCANLPLKNGQRVTIEGSKSGDEVKVSQLTTLE